MSLPVTSSRPPATAMLFLTGRWARSKAARRSSVILALTFAVLALVFVCVSAFTPTAEQKAEAAFGTFDQRTYTNVNVGDLDPGFLTRTNAELTSELPGSHLLIESTDLRPDSFVKTYVQAPLAPVRFVQDPTPDGLQGAFPGRYNLKEGTWPQSPFDVVVSQHVLDTLPDAAVDAGEFTVLSRRATMHIVGVVQDTFAKRGDLIVGGPSTWESIPRPSTGREFQPVQATLSALFRADTSVIDVGKVLKQALPPVPEIRTTSLDGLKSNLTTRAQIEAEPVAEFGSDQLVVSYLPLLLVILLVSALVVGQTRGPLRDNADRLVVLGVRRGQVRLTQVTALSVVAAASIAGGLAAGWLLALALRALVLPHFADQTLSPVPGPDATALVIAGGSLVLISTGLVWPERRTHTARPSVIKRLLARVPASTIRRALALAVGIAALRVEGTVTSVVASYLAVAAVLLVAPDVLRGVVWLLPRRFPRTFVTRRLMTVDIGRQAAAVAVIGCCLALPITVGTQLASKKASDASYSYSIVPVGQIWVQSGDSGSGGDIEGVAQAVSEVPGIGAPVVLRDVSYAVGPPQKGDSAAMFSKTPTSGNSNSTIMVLDDAGDLGRLVGDQLPDDAVAVLDDGGVLDFTNVVGDQKLVVNSATSGKRLFVTPALRTLKVSLDAQFSKSFGGAILRSTARELKLPVKPPARIIYTDATPTLIEEAATAAVDAGYDSQFVQYSVPPPEPVLPTNAYVFLTGLVLGGFAVLLYVVRGQAKRLRDYSSRLVAIGLGPRWSLSVLGIQAALTIGVGLLAGISAGLLGVQVTSANYAVTSVPTLPITIACGATVLAAALATTIAARALTATEYSEVT